MKKSSPTNSTPEIISKVDSTVWAESIGRTSWTYIRTLVDTAHEPFVVLDQHFSILAANESFYDFFKVSQKDVENKALFELGNGQWNIPALRKLLEEILPKDTFFRGFEVEHEFPLIGHRVMLLNARRIYQDQSAASPEPIILLALEDITEMTSIATKLASHAKKHVIQISDDPTKLEAHLKELAHLKKKVKTLKATITQLSLMIKSFNHKERKPTKHTSR